MSHKGTREYTNPAIYDAHHKDFQKQGLPSGQAEWVERARQVAAILAQDAPQRDIINKAPAAEVSLLKSSGLLKVLGPKSYGGGGEPWDTAYKTIREVAKADGSIGMLLGYHLLWSTTANVVGTEDQAKSVQKVLIEQNLVRLSEFPKHKRSCLTIQSSSSEVQSTHATAISRSPQTATTSSSTAPRISTQVVLYPT
jgi:hypothetical protein